MNQALIKRQWALGLMLLSLHALLLGDFSNPLHKAFLICHYGLFLIWQPLWRAQDRLSLPASLLFISAALLMVLFINWWLLAFWICGLFGLLGGRILSTRAQSTRIGYLLAASYLLAMLLLWVVPKLLNAEADVAVTGFMTYYLTPILPVAILLTEAETASSDSPPVLDFFYSLLLFMLAVILVLGSFAIQTSSRADYAVIILRVLFGGAITLFTASWLWNPRLGFTGLGQLLSRYLLSVGLPFEQWVKNIAELAEQESSPRQFIASAMQEVLNLRWISGVRWQTADEQGELGTPARHHAIISFHDFHLTLYTRWALTPALTIHLKLLTQILGEFYEAKRREESLRQNTYMQAVYETGSRLTHDIKNLVQSMSTLCAIAEQDMEGDSKRLLALIRRQLPQLNQRLALTLDKLEAPHQNELRQLKLSAWWRTTRQRYSQQERLTFSALEAGNISIDAEMLDSVVDNLLQNALEKARVQPEISIHCSVSLDQDKLGIEVADTGQAIAGDIVSQLFRKHVASDNGLGIGLYHAARHARQAGYTLTLAENRDGSVRFRLQQL